LNYDNINLVEQVLADVESYARRSRALFVKIDPDVPRHLGEARPDQPLEPTGQAVANLLDRRGWRLSPEQIQFRNTVLIDLTPAPDELLAAMKSKWRYNIRLAERQGVSIRGGGPDNLAAFYQMYAETAARDGFLIRPEAYYREVWGSFLDSGQAELLLAMVDEEVVAGLMLFFCPQTAWYMYGASSGQHRQWMPNHALQWAAIGRAKARGCCRYDLWGAPDVFDESDRLWGVYRFKQGFGGQVVQWLGAYDFPINRSLYFAFSQAMPRLRALLRRLRVAP
jgi:lipid II:glycine glycyltransferase (peptidoglycan interpeptide bridge formation enzyme)